MIIYVQNIHKGKKCYRWGFERFGGHMILGVSTVWTVAVETVVWEAMTPGWEAMTPGWDMMTPGWVANINCWPDNTVGWALITVMLCVRLFISRAIWHQEQMLHAVVYTQSLNMSPWPKRQRMGITLQQCERNRVIILHSHGDIWFNRLNRAGVYHFSMIFI